MKEVWKDIVGFEGLYQVSNLGRVKSLARTIINNGNIYNKRELILKGGFKDKYHLVCLSKDGKPTSVSIHRLVGQAFLPNPENKPEINHINSDRGDNRVENLEWCTSSENTVHAIKIGRHKDHNQKAVQQINVFGEVVREYKSIEDTKKYGFNPSAVRHVVSGAKDRKMHKGFIWKYLHSTTKADNQ